MYLHLLSKTQKTSFVGIARTLMEVDGVSVPEQKLLKAMRKEMDLVDEGSVQKSLSSLVKPFKSKKSKVVLLLELFGIALVDGTYTKPEGSVIGEVAQLLEVPKSELRKYLNWVRKQIRLVDEANELMEV